MGLVEIKQGDLLLAVGWWQLKCRKGKGVKLHFGGGNALDVGGEGKRSVENDSAVSYLSHEGMKVPLSVIKKTRGDKWRGVFTFRHVS